jgi:single-strand DNA-binding protein
MTVTYREGAVFMADGLNRVLLLGNLGADPELKMTPRGQAVLKMRLATSESYLDRNRVRQERTEWHQVVVWGKRAEALAKFLTKGSRLFVEGGLRTSSYDDREGNKRYKTEIVANNIILAGSGGGRGASSRPSTAEAATPDDSGEPAPSAGGGYEDDFSGGGDDDIPF